MPCLTFAWLIKPFFLAVGMSRAECMPESKVLNANELETVCDTAIRLFINSVTEQLATETIVGVQLIDFFNRGVSLDGACKRW